MKRILVVALALASACSKTTAPARAFQITTRSELIGGKRALGDVEAAPVDATDLISGVRASSADGDYKLSNGVIHAIIQNVGTSRGFGSFGGSLIDIDLVRSGAGNEATGVAGNDYFTEMFPAFFLTALEPAKVEVLRDGSDGASAAIRVSGSSGQFISLVKPFTSLVDPKQVLDFTCDYVLEPGKQYLKIIVTVTNNTAQDAQYGLAVPFGFVTLLGEGQRLFVPGEAGFDMRFHLEEVYKRPADLSALPGEVTNMWATEGDGVSYAFVTGRSPNGNYLEGKDTYYPTAGKDSMLIPIASSSFLGTYFAKPPNIIQKKGGSYSYSAYLAVGSGDVASVQKVVYDLKDIEIRGSGREFIAHDTTATGQISGRVRENKTLQPLSGVSIVLQNEKGEYVSQATTQKNGVWTASVPPGSYSASAVDKTRSVARTTKPVAIEAGAIATLDMTMDQPGDLRVTIRDDQGRALPAKINVIGTYESSDYTKLPRQFFYDLPIGERYLAGDLVQDTSDPTSRQYLEKQFYAVDGVIGGQVRPGKYTVYASRGLEYDLQSQEVEIKAGQTTQLGFTLTHVLPTPGWISADFHVHSIKSVDSSMDLPRRVSSYAVEGVDLVTSTDHNYVTDHGPTIDALKLDHWLASTVGLELTTLEMGHFNAYPLQLLPGPVQHGSFRWFFRPPAELFAQLRALGSDPQLTVVQVNHPRDTILGYYNAFNISNYTGEPLPAYSAVSLDQSPLPDGGVSPYDPSNFSREFDAMEVFNGKRFDNMFPYRIPAVAPDGPEPGIRKCAAGEPTTEECLPAPGEILNRVVKITTPGQPERFELQPLQPGSMLDWYNMLSKGYKTIATGNSDSHGEKAEAGLPRTYVNAGPSSDGPMRNLDQTAVYTALNQRKAFVTNGPIVELTINGQGIGTTVIAGDGAIDAHIVIKAAPWVDIKRVTVRRGQTTGPVRQPEVLEVIEVPDSKEVVRLDITKHYTGIVDSSFIIVDVAGDRSMWPVFTPYEVPSLEISDAVGVIGGAFGFGATFGKYKVDMKQQVKPYAFTNPIWVDRTIKQGLTAQKRVLPVSNDQPFVPRVLPDLRKLYHAYHSDLE